MKINKILIGLLSVAIVTIACKKDTPEDETDLDAIKTSVKTTYANIAYATYNDAYNHAVVLKNAIDAFVANPSQDLFAQAKLAWLASRESYGQTEVFRFANGPIDDADGPEGLINAWPLDESYIDYVEGDVNAGIINDLATYPTLSIATLEDANENGGEENISVGYHAIEFLLWGQDDPNEALLMGGDRPFTDYTTADNADRRGEVLKFCAEALVGHLLTIKNEWDASGVGNYRATWLALSNDAALTKMLTGMGVLSKAELAGERIFVAINNQDQEDEHSCFSDNTHRDIYQNAHGIYNLYTGSYRKTDGSWVSGTGIKDLINEVDATTASALDTEAENAIFLAEAIPAPFDYNLKQETVTGDGPIMQAVKSLQAQGDLLATTASKLGLTVSVALPE